MMSTLIGKFRQYINNLVTVFGGRFILLLFITQCLLKGLVFAIMTDGILPLFKSLGVTATNLQLYGALALSPWTIKPLYGVISDLIAIDGYHKRHWMNIAAFVGIIGASFMVVEPHIPAALTFFMFMIHTELSICDLLSEGKYAEIMRDNKETGSSIVSLVTAFQSIGGLLGMALIGPLADQGLYRIFNLVALIMCVTPIGPLCRGWMPEKSRSGPWVMLDTAELLRNWKVITVVSIVGILAPVTASITVFANRLIGLIAALVALIVSVVFGYVWMPNRIIGHVALYQVLTMLSRISFDVPIQYFMLAGDECVPGGPNFSYKFLITVSGIVGAVTGLLFSGIYEVGFTNWRYRNVLIFTTFLSGASGIFDFIIIKRWNIAWGIPDWVMFLVGADAMEKAVGTLNWIPNSSILGKVCPKGMESSTYAYLAGVSNFARMVSTIAGAWIADVAGVRDGSVPGEACNWDALPWLILGGHIASLLIVSVPAAWLLPNKFQYESLLEDEVVTEEVELDEEEQEWEDVSEDDFN